VVPAGRQSADERGSGSLAVTAVSARSTRSSTRGVIVTSAAAAHLRPGGGVEIEPDACLLAINTKMAFTVASLLFGIGQGHRHSSGGADMVIP
jgi:hypothetical protein